MDDCYFFLYSSCKFNDKCVYRHNESCRNNLVTCRNWKSKAPCTEECPYRHSEYHLKKNRRNEMCYWEDKPSGCTKGRCEYRHMDPMKDAWKKTGAAGAGDPLLPQPSSTASCSGSEQQASGEAQLRDYEEVMDVQSQPVDPDMARADGEPPKQMEEKAEDEHKDVNGMCKKSKDADGGEAADLQSEALGKHPVDDRSELLKSDMDSKRIKTNEAGSSVAASKATVDLDDLDKEIEELDHILMD